MPTECTGLSRLAAALTPASGLLLSLRASRSRCGVRASGGFLLRMRIRLTMTMRHTLLGGGVRVQFQPSSGSEAAADPLTQLEESTLMCDRSRVEKSTTRLQHATNFRFHSRGPPLTPGLSPDCVGLMSRQHRQHQHPRQHPPLLECNSVLKLYHCRNT
jgi:hypothetical protein